MTSNFTSTEIITETKQTLKVAIPLIVHRTIFALSGFLATVMLAGLGHQVLAAHSLSWSIYLTFTVSFIGLLSSVGILLAQSFGAKDFYSIKIIFIQGLILATISTPIVMLALWLCQTVLIWTNQDPLVVELTKPAFISLMWTIFPLNIMVVVQQFFIGVNRAYLVTLMSALTVPMEIFFFYVFIFGKFGFPQLGLSSVGYGISLSYAIIAIPLLFYILFSKRFKAYALWKNLRIDPKIFFELIRVGLPLGFMTLMEVGFFFVAAIMVGKLGARSLAAYHISHQYFIIAVMILIALTITAAIRVGTEAGRHSKRNIKLAAIITSGIAFVLMTCFSFFYIKFPKLAISLDIDINDLHLQDVVAEASSALLIVGILLLIESIYLATSGALRGLKDTATITVVSFIGFWCISFPIAYLLCFKFHLGVPSIWYGLLIGISICTIILYLRFKRLLNRVNLKTLVIKAEK